MANAITRAREKAGLTQTALAEKTGINVRTIQKYEYGEYDTRNMTLKSALTLADALSCKVEDLIEQGRKEGKTEKKENENDKI